ncbi:phage tail protein [uncultured Brachyspira sp.]|uniref:phage tail protein n=1 Tax=uncultured Brachyspira sp. TaxID=221953 RepID=UPI00260C36CE|nr:phage tail protein [uncultured Brachyspira sp.]
MLNNNNIQAPFQYKISENTFELLERSGELELNTNNVQVKVFQGQRLFCADIGYAVDGALENTEFLIDDIKVYPHLLEELEDLQSVEVKDNEIYLIQNDINFKSIIFFPSSDLNKNFKYKINTYSSTFCAFMLDEIADKLNNLDNNYPIKNYYKDTDYKINDIIKYKGYLYRVFRDFTSDDTDYYLKTNCSLITPFRKLELNTLYKSNELVEYNNNFFIVQKDFNYDNIANINDILKPLQDIVEWNNDIKNVYKNQIILKDNFCYLVLRTSENYTFDELLQFKKIDYLNKASNTFYDDSNSSFGSSTNTVQKAIEKLKYNKQDSLISGNNINLNGNTISVCGGTNKEYAEDTSYFINDLIIRNENIYKVDEDFTASNWNEDRSKLTLISLGGGGFAEAIDVSFDNSKTNLEYISGYNFPKFKAQIPNNINLVLSNILTNEEYTANITKQEDGSYILNTSITNFYLSASQKAIVLEIKNIEGETNSLFIFNTINMFWHVVSSDEWINNNGDVVIENVSEPTQFEFIGSALAISKTDLSDFEQGIYNITLTIKNRHYQPIDTYFLGVVDNERFTFNYMSYLNLQNNNGSVKLAGNIKIEDSFKTVLYYSFLKPYLENYFNLSTNNTFINTAQITSNTGKAVKYYFKQNADYENAADLVIAYQDGSTISIGDIFTLNLIPDKNREVNPLLYPVSNVQQLGEALNEKADNISDRLNIIADEQEHFTGRYFVNSDGGRKPIYYMAGEPNAKNYTIPNIKGEDIEQFIHSDINFKRNIKDFDASGIPIYAAYLTDIGLTYHGHYIRRIPAKNTVAIYSKTTANEGPTGIVVYDNFITSYYFEYIRTSDSWEY